MAGEAGSGGIGLEIKAGQLGGFLLIAIELGEAVLEGVGEQEGHGKSGFGTKAMPQPRSS